MLELRSGTTNAITLLPITKYFYYFHLSSFFFLFSFFTLFYSIVDIKSYIFQHLVLVIELNSKFYDKDLLFMSRTLGDVIIN